MVKIYVSMESVKDLDEQIFFDGWKSADKEPYELLIKLCHQGRSKELSFLQFIEKIGNRI